MQCSFDSVIASLLNNPQLRYSFHEMLNYGLDLYFEDEEVKQAKAELKKQKKIRNKEQERKMKASPAWRKLESRKKDQEKILKIQGIQAQALLERDKIKVEINKIERGINSAYRPGNEAELNEKLKKRWIQYDEVRRLEQREIQRILKK